ncbi:spore germination protein [Kyrpidia spormannii]|uniref:Spore germination protein n=1 Tax=Kyrpidia spormannii TaxID=2055160 RepID=A0A6F9E0Z8_9BACL|nr:spore germination protein [Kyrpidia spormannii]CAB3390052.1 Spore germination protein [Kyrpidia spormannii]
MGVKLHVFNEAIRQFARENDDVVQRVIPIVPDQSFHLLFLQMTVDIERIERFIIQPVEGAVRHWGDDLVTSLEWEEEIRRWVVPFTVKTVPIKQLTPGDLLEGSVLLATEGHPRALVISAPAKISRNIDQPINEVAIRGPKDAFTENTDQNLTLVRRRLADPALRVKRFVVGRRTRTAVYLLYLVDVADSDLVKTITDRINRIDIDGVLDSAYIEKQMTDNWFSPFPRVRNTERPDVVVAGLLEGRVAILVDNSTEALVLPCDFNSIFHAPDDVYDHWTNSILLRGVRFVASVIAVSVPPAYVTFLAYSPGAMPLKLTLLMQQARYGVAFPVVLEALFVQLLLEILKEAGLHMPTTVAQIFGIIGGIILSEAGVRAGFFSESMLVAIGVTGIASLSVPLFRLGTTLRLLGLPLLLSAGFLGLYGFVMAGMFVLAHLAGLRSCDVPYLSPYFLGRWSDFKDTIIRMPAPFITRPAMLNPRDLIRAKKRK